MSVLFLTRFSIPDCFSSTQKHFQLSRNKTEEKYKEELFSKKRLDKKMIYFKRLTFPSIIKQKNKNWKWYIFISFELPEEYILQLEKLINPFSKQIFMHQVQDILDFKSLSSRILEEIPKPYISSRIDDDDGISENFVEQILFYIGMDKHIINFINGRISFYNQYTNDIEYGNSITYFNNSVGLSVINYNIFDLGNHIKIHNKNNIIYNNQKDMFYLTHDPNICDTKRPLKN